MDDKVSIITPSYNTAEFIGQTIESILAQSYTNWELLIIEDGSTDKSRDVIIPYTEKDSRIRLIELEGNNGPAIARNAGIKQVRGRYIAFLDSDDLWKPEKLNRQIRFMRDVDCSFSFTAYQKIDEQNNIIGTVLGVPENIDYNGLLLSCVIGCLTAIYDTNKLGKVYMPDLPKGQDYALWLKILRGGHLAYGLNENLALYRIRQNSISRNKLKKAHYQWRIYRDVEQLSLFKSLFYMINYTYYGYLRLRS